MSEVRTTIAYLSAIPLIAHGLAHISGFIASWTEANVGLATRPRVLSSGVTRSSRVGLAFSLLWLVAAAGVVGAGLGILSRQEWWADPAFAASVISLVAIVTWWNTLPRGRLLPATHGGDVAGGPARPSL